MSTFLPKLFRVAFTVLAVLAAFAAVCTLAALLIDPELPPDARFGPKSGEFLGQSASAALQPVAEGQTETALHLRAFNGHVAMTVNQPAGAVEVFKTYGLPLWLLYALFLTTLFELLRRLFRNVGHGESFTSQSVRLVQIIGGALIVYSFACAIAESWFAYSMYGYLVEHTQISISGAPVELPPARSPSWFGYKSPFKSEFFAGLLVLALAEVFRQGLALKRDADLTV